MKRVVCIVVLLVVLLLPVGVGANEEMTEGGTITEESVKSIIEKSGLSELEAYFSEVAGEYLGTDSFVGAILNYLSGEDSTSGSIWEVVKNTAKEAFLGSTGSIALIVALMIFLSLLNMLSDSFGSFQSGQAAFYAVYLTMLLLLCSFVFTTIQSANTAIASISEFMSVLMVPMMALMAISGAVSSAAVLSPMLLMYINLVSSIVSGVVIPLFTTSFAVGMIDEAAELKLSGLRKLLKQAGYLIIGVITVTFSGISFIKGIAFSALDGVGGKGVKYALNNLIPVLGRFLADSADTVLSASLLIKNGAGLVACIIIFLMILTPVLKMAVTIITLKLCSALLEGISDARCIRMIKGATDMMMQMLTCVCLVAVMFLLFIAIVCVMANFTAMMR